jgi:cytochrome c biogenesis factor
MDEEHLLVGGTVLITIVIIVVSLAATIIPIIFLLKKLGNISAGNQQLLMTGIPAQARVVTLGQTGLSVNNSPQMNVTLEIHPPQSPGYRGAAAPWVATVQSFIPMHAMGRVQPGGFVNVRFDPMNPMRVAIDFRSMGFV